MVEYFGGGGRDTRSLVGFAQAEWEVKCGNGCWLVVGKPVTTSLEDI